jgi:hypothetical protein
MIKRKDGENARPVTKKTPEKRGKTDGYGFGRKWFEEAFLGDMGAIGESVT